MDSIRRRLGERDARDLEVVAGQARSARSSASTRCDTARVCAACAESVTRTMPKPLTSSSPTTKTRKAERHVAVRGDSSQREGSTASVAREMSPSAENAAGRGASGQRRARRPRDASRSPASSRPPSAFRPWKPRGPWRARGGRHRRPGGVSRRWRDPSPRAWTSGRAVFGRRSRPERSCSSRSQRANGPLAGPRRRVALPHRP